MRADRFSLEDTIVALATPPGRSALALIRVSGRGARAILARVAPDLPSPPPERRPTLVTLAGSVEGSEGPGAAGSRFPIDRTLVTFFPGPGSATGEDVFEVSLHGSPVVVAAALEVLAAAGARPARPGEFTERAFLLGKIDLVEAEAVRELIESRTPAAARASARRVSGELSRSLELIREDLTRAAAELAATIDFSEDVGETVAPETPRRVAAAAAGLRLLFSTAGRGTLLSEGARVVFLGRPNAGKSTLFNALAGMERAIVTDVPGTTRDTLEAALDIDGVPVSIIDTAGLRVTDDPVERIGVGRARAAGTSADAIFYVFDASTGWTAEDDREISGLDSECLLLVANKIDCLAPGAPESGAALPPSAAARRLFAICGISVGAGERLRSELAGCWSVGPPAEALSAILGSARQRDAVRRALSSAEAAQASLSGGESPEYGAAHVHDALDALADLVGETTADDVLNRIFSTFCIGK